MAKSALVAKIEGEMTAAMKAKNEAVLSALRMIKSAFQYKAIELKKELTDEDALDVLMKQAKQRRESIEGFTKGNRQDLADKEKAELALIEKFLPQQMTEDEIKALAQEVIKAVGATSAKEMGKVMASLNPKVKGKADMGKVSGIVKSLLG